MNRKMTHGIKQIFFYLFVIVFVGIIILPFLWQFLTSIKPMSEISAIPAKWIPSEINIQYYFNVFEKHPFGRYFKYLYVPCDCDIEPNLSVVKAVQSVEYVSGFDYPVYYICTAACDLASDEFLLTAS